MTKNAEDKLNALVARVGKVRRWLVALAILRIAALCLIFVSVFTGFYAWLDHRLNFNEIARVTAFVLLVAGLVFLFRSLTKLLLCHVSCSAAANFIENKKSFNQQLVAAIEYYESKQNYPYSKALAEQLVLKVDKACEEFRFDSAVEKWQAFALGAIIFFGLVIGFFYVRDNYVFFSSYFARLVNPLASVEPLSSTRLESITRNLVAEPNSPVRFAAGIKGHIPDSVKLVLVEIKPDIEVDGKEQNLQEIQIKPGFSEGKPVQFEATKSFSHPGKFRYRFETDTTTTEWHELNISPTPEIESITAQVSVPKRQPRSNWVKPYIEQIENHTLQVVQGSSVILNMRANERLSEMTVTGPDGKPVTRQLNGAEELDFHFTADKNGSVKFGLINEHGLANENIPDLQVIVKTDEAPKFKLVSPDGDYLATDVASVPVTFEVTDDFGLESAKLCLEIPGQQPKEIAVPVEEGIKSTEFTHTIELEKYDLTVGDSILFSAKATDIDTGSESANRTSSSDIYFIEIRPYRQNWVPMPGGGPSQGAGSPPLELLNILEYTRAIIKKTWAIASKPELIEQDRSRLGFINQDIQYCAEQVALIRDDSQYGFEENHKAVLNEVIRYFEQTSRYLAAHDASSALTPEKNAYRILRKFILELELNWSPPSSSQGQQPKTPDSVKLQEKPEFEGYEKERIEAQLKKMQQKLDKLTRQQGQLQWSLENFLEQQSSKKATQQSSNNKPPESNAEKQGQDANDAGQQSDSSEQEDKNTSSSKSASSSRDSSSKEDSSAKSQSPGKGTSVSNPSDATQSTSENRESSQGQSPGESKSTSEGRDLTEGASPNQSGTEVHSQSHEQSSGANAEARLRMLQAKQRLLQEQVSQLKNELQELPESSNGGNSRAESQQHLSEAAANMNEFQTEMAEARFQAEMDEQSSDKAVALMESARSELDMANKALGRELTLSDDEKLAREAQDMSEQLSEGADTLSESVTDVERQDMLARLEAAKRLLETMPEPQWSTVNKGSSSPSGAGRVLTKNPNISSAETARQMARRFWSIAINAKKHHQQLLENEPSDAEFYGQENDFFENAARYNQEQVEK